MRTFCKHTSLISLFITICQGDKPFMFLQSVLSNAPVKDPQQVCEMHPHTQSFLFFLLIASPFSLIFARMTLFRQTQHSISSHMYPMCVEQMRGPSVISILFVSTVSHNLVYTLRLL